MKLLTYKPLTHCFIFSVKTFGKYKSNEDQYELVSQYRTKVLIQEKYCQKQRKHTKKKNKQTKFQKTTSVFLFTDAKLCLIFFPTENLKLLIKYT